MEKIKVDFVFVILHYNAVIDTKECVASIAKNVISKYTYQIIIVDNCSPNKSGKELVEYYRNNDIVKVLIAESNLGFARGNNLGCLYASKKYDFKFLVMLNNDTLLIDANFCDLVFHEYSVSKFAVLGPKVITPSMPYDSNPGPGELRTIAYCKDYIFRMHCLLLLNMFHLDFFYKKVKRLFSKDNMGSSREINEKRENVQLHGCFWIFSPIYTSKFIGINDKTFLYREEELLFLRLKQNKMKSVYLPDLKIYHKEDRSTNTINKTSHSRMRFFYLNMLKSTKVLLNELESEA